MGQCISQPWRYSQLLTTTTLETSSVCLGSGLGLGLGAAGMCTFLLTMVCANFRSTRAHDCLEHPIRTHGSNVQSFLCVPGAATANSLEYRVEVVFHVQLLHAVARGCAQRQRGQQPPKTTTAQCNVHRYIGGQAHRCPGCSGPRASLAAVRHSIPSERPSTMHFGMEKAARTAVRAASLADASLDTTTMNDTSGDAAAVRGCMAGNPGAKM